MRWGVRMNGADEDLPKSELVGSRLDKLRSIQEANKSVRRPFQFTLSQFFVATLVLALAWTVFPRPFLSLAIAITVPCALELAYSPWKWNLWISIALAWILTVLETAAFWRWFVS